MSRSEPLYALPAVVGTGGATSRLDEGDLVEVDGSTGGRSLDLRLIPNGLGRWMVRRTNVPRRRPPPAAWSLESGLAIPSQFGQPVPALSSKRSTDSSARSTGPGDEPGGPLAVRRVGREALLEPGLLACGLHA